MNSPFPRVKRPHLWVNCRNGEQVKRIFSYYLYMSIFVAVVSWCLWLLYPRNLKISGVLCFWLRRRRLRRRKPFCEEKKLCIDLKRWEMLSKVIFGHPKWPPAAILFTKWKIKVWYWSEMARNAIESDFRSSKLAAGSHFVNKIKKKLTISCLWLFVYVAIFCGWLLTVWPVTVYGY